MSKELETINGHILKVLEVIFKGPKTWPEISDETGLDGQIVTRVLEDYLSFWKLVQKDDYERWAFFKHKPVPSKEPRLKRIHIKKVLEVLFKGPKTWTEIKEETELKARIVTRVLVDYLSFWQLVKKDVYSRWAFIATIEKDTLAVKHAQDILGDLMSYSKLVKYGAVDSSELSNDVDTIAFVERDDPSIFLWMFRRHLEEGYKETWKLFQSYAELSKQYDYPPILLLSLAQGFKKGAKKRGLIPALDTESIEERVVPDVHLKRLKEDKSELIEFLRDLEINVFLEHRLEGDCRYCSHIEKVKTKRDQLSLSD